MCTSFSKDTLFFCLPPVHNLKFFTSTFSSEVESIDGLISVLLELVDSLIFEAVFAFVCLTDSSSSSDWLSKGLFFEVFLVVAILVLDCFLVGVLETGLTGSVMRLLDLVTIPSSSLLSLSFWVVPVLKKFIGGKLSWKS